MHIQKDDLLEGLYEQELRDLVHHEIHIDEFQAKIGTDDQIVVVSFKVKYKQAAEDFESFLEKGYDYVLDAETSEAEFEDGWYLVFVEFERRLDFPQELARIIHDLKNITNTTDWKFRYGATRSRNVPEWKLTSENLRKVVPMSPKKYRELADLDIVESQVLENLLMASHVKIKSKNVAKELTESQYQMRLAAGIPVDGYIIVIWSKR